MPSIYIFFKYSIDLKIENLIPFFQIFPLSHRIFMVQSMESKKKSTTCDGVNRSSIVFYLTKFECIQSSLQIFPYTRQTICAESRAIKKHRANKTYCSVIYVGIVLLFFSFFLSNLAANVCIYIFLTTLRQLTESPHTRSRFQCICSMHYVYFISIKREHIYIFM